MELWLVVTDGNQSRGSCCPLADTSVLYALTLFLVWVESFSLPLSKEGWSRYGFQRAELCGTWATPQLALTPPDCARLFPSGAAVLLGWVLWRGWRGRPTHIRRPLFQPRCRLQQPQVCLISTCPANTVPASLGR